MTLAGPGLGAGNIRQEGLRARVTMKDAPLAALLVIDHHLQGEVGVARPLGIGGLAAIADEVSRVGLDGGSPFKASRLL